MEIRIVQRAGNNQAFIIDDIQKAATVAGLSAEEATYATGVLNSDQTFVTINRYRGFAFIILLKTKKTDWQTAESLRKSGAELQVVCNKYKIADITVTNASTLANAGLLVAEGTALANYQFLKYRSEAKKLTNTLQKISFTKDTSTVKDAAQLQITVDAIYKARTLVNEPLNSLSAVELAREIAAMGKAAGFKVTTLTKPQIVKEKMGGLLAVNRGSIQPPAFSVMEYVPRKPLNKKPIVLVGKGVVYDTGGLSLKPTANSMDRMKSDMSGAAVVSCAMYAIAKMQLPLHVVALVPATDN